MESKPEFNLKKKTNTKMAYLFSAIMSLFLIFMITMTWERVIDPNSPDRIGFIGTYIFFSLIVILPIIFGILRKEVTLIFKVNEQNNALIYESHWGNYLTFSKSYLFNEIKGFEVHNVYANKRGFTNQVTQNQLLALCFQNRRPKYFTNFQDNENSTDFARNLNKYLADHTQVNIDPTALNTTPYTPQRQKKNIKIYRAILGIMVVFTIVMIIWILTYNP